MVVSCKTNDARMNNFHRLYDALAISITLTLLLYLISLLSHIYFAAAAFFLFLLVASSTINVYKYAMLRSIGVDCACGKILQSLLFD